MFSQLLSEKIGLHFHFYTKSYWFSSRSIFISPKKSHKQVCKWNVLPFRTLYDESALDIVSRLCPDVFNFQFFGLA